MESYCDRELAWVQLGGMQRFPKMPPPMWTQRRKADRACLAEASDMGLGRAKTQGATARAEYSKVIAARES